MQATNLCLLRHIVNKSIERNHDQTITARQGKVEVWGVKERFRAIGVALDAFKWQVSEASGEPWPRFEQTITLEIGALVIFSSPGGDKGGTLIGYYPPGQWPDESTDSQRAVLSALLDQKSQGTE